MREKYYSLMAACRELGVSKQRFLYHYRQIGGARKLDFAPHKYRYYPDTVVFIIACRLNNDAARRFTEAWLREFRNFRRVSWLRAKKGSLFRLREFID